MVSVSISFWWNEPEPPTTVKLLFEFIHGHRARLYQISSLDINLCTDFNDNSNNRWPVILNLLVFFISATIPRKFRIDLLVLVIQLLLGFFCFNDGLKSSPTCTWRNCHMISTSLSSPVIYFYGNVFFDRVHIKKIWYYIRWSCKCFHPAVCKEDHKKLLEFSIERAITSKK